jgi:ABC-type antimicrobial peptide transport system permease subunit
MGQGAQLAALGLAAGVLGALAITHIMTKLLFGVTPTDPVAFAGAVLIMLAVVMLACFVPARRALRVDPMIALRYE